MYAEWTAECGSDDPMIVIPWADPDGTARFVDLRAEPFDIAEIPEAEDHPAIRRALRSLNASGSGFFTSKCDVWTLSPEEGGDKLESLRLDLDLTDEEVGFGFGSYLDVLWRERSIFASAHMASERLSRLARRAWRRPCGPQWWMGSSQAAEGRWKALPPRCTSPPWPAIPRPR